MSEEMNNPETGKEEPVPAEENKEEKPQAEPVDDSTQGTSPEESNPAEAETREETPGAPETAASEEKAEAANPSTDAANPVDSAEEVKQEQKPTFNIKELLKKKWLWAIAAAAVLLIILCATHVICISHDYLPATCTEPSTCRYCGKTEGEALGHDWKAATCTKPEACSRCGETLGEALGHQWEAATCTEPETCSRCGETQGQALGHQWEAATCTEPKTCSVCEMTEGSPLGHDFKNKTSSNPGICRRCGVSDLVGLWYSSWVYKSKNIESYISIDEDGTVLVINYMDGSYSNYEEGTWTYGNNLFSEKNDNGWVHYNVKLHITLSSLYKFDYDCYYTYNNGKLIEAGGYVFSKSSE